MVVVSSRFQSPLGFSFSNLFIGTSVKGLVTPDGPVSLVNVGILNSV